jgi:3-deoxy-manno-octulosonate cytidylyltransferase (CMP-KDO synthetase)
MPVLLVIPARFASTRYPGKPLVELTGATGERRSLVRRRWEAAAEVPGVDRVVDATDDARIADAARGFGAEVAMTPDTCRNGTERCAAVLADLPGYDVVVNLQGDAPLTPPWFVSALVEAMQADPSRMMATPVLRCDAAALEGFLDDRRHGRVGATTAVFDRAGRALYFSKEVIPYTGGALAPGAPILGGVRQGKPSSRRIASIRGTSLGLFSSQNERPRASTSTQWMGTPLSRKRSCSSPSTASSGPIGQPG